VPAGRDEGSTELTRAIREILPTQLGSQPQRRARDAETWAVSARALRGIVVALGYLCSHVGGQPLLWQLREMNVEVGR
jgi:hypothetical protein